MAHRELRLFQPRRIAPLDRDAVADRRPDASVAGHRRAGARAARPRFRNPRPRQIAEAGGAFVGSLCAAGLSQDRAGPAFGPDRLDVHRSRAARPRRRKLHGRAGAARRFHRRRHRYAVAPYCADPHLDLRFQSSWLACRSGTLAGKNARDRRQTVGCAARAVDETVRRPQDFRAHEAPEREYDVRSRNQLRRRSARRRASCRRIAGFPLYRRPVGRGRGCQGREGRCTESTRRRV